MRPLSSSRFEGDLLSWSYCRPPYDDCQLRREIVCVSW